jgi:hypothetical protein
MNILVIIGLAVVAFLAVGIMLGRQTKRQKLAAIEDLKREKEQIAQQDIFTLIMAEIEDLDLRSIPGAQDLQPGVLLKSWSDNKELVERCPDRSKLRFVVAEGVEPEKAADEDVTLVCEGHPDDGDLSGDDPTDEEAR